MKKNYFLLLLTIFLGFISLGQTVSIGIPGITTNQAIPIEPYYGWTYAQCIYPASELTTAGMIGVKQIDTITFYYTGTNLNYSDSWVVYLGHTSKSTFSSGTDWEPLSSLTQVFNGTATVTAITGGNNLVKIALSSPFYWDGTSNLMVAVDENKTGYGSSSDDFYCRSTTGKRSISYRSDATNPDPASPPTASYEQFSVPNLSISYSTPPSCLPPSALSATGITVTDATLSWTELGTASIWEYEYDSPGFTLGTGTRDTTNSNPTTITGLSSLTNYEYYVRSVCGTTDSSTWAGPFSFLTACASQLSGVYTLDPASAASATNFIAMADFMSFLGNCGVSGPTTLNVSSTSGPHVMGQDLGAYPGMSSVNTVAINGNGTTINRGVGTYFLALNGVKYLTIQNFNFINEIPTSSVFGIMMRGGCDNITIKNNTINVGLNISSGPAAAPAVCIVAIATISITSAATYGDNANNCRITGNTLIGGFAGIIMEGQGFSGPFTSGHIIDSNDIQDFSDFGIRLYYAANNELVANEIHRPNIASGSGSAFYGIYGNYSSTMKIIGNKIHNGGAGSWTAYGIYARYGNSNSATDGTEIANNAVYDLNAQFTFYGVYVGNSAYTNVHHNTFETTTDGSTSTKYGIYHSGAPNNVDYKNNLISIKGTGTSPAYGIYNSSTSTSFASNYNLVYVNSGGTNYYGRNGSNYATQAAWNTGTTFGANSLDINPSIVATL